MRKKNFIITSILLLSLSVLSACNAGTGVVEKTNTKEEVQEYSVETFKVVGDEKNGFIKIPQDFTFTPYKGMPEEVFPNYVNEKGNFTVQIAMSDLITSFEDATRSFSFNYKEKGREVATMKTTIAGFEAVELHAYSKEDSIHEFAYFLKGNAGYKVIMFNYEGENYSTLKESILSTYSEKMAK